MSRAATPTCRCTSPAPSRARWGSSCPAGDGIAFLADDFTRVALGCASDPPQTFSPLARDVVVPGGMPPTTLAALFTTQVPPGTPSGAYTVFLVLTAPGAFADGRVDPTEL